MGIAFVHLLQVFARPVGGRLPRVFQFQRGVGEVAHTECTKCSDPQRRHRSDQGAVEVRLSAFYFILF